jgi:protoheme IX farnesyltransferase
VGLVVFTAATGFLLASTGSADWLRLVWALIGTALAAAGANALNQWSEMRLDALMERTRGRPLPSGRVHSQRAFFWALVLCIAGPVVLAAGLNLLAAGLALSAELVYVLVYTPLKVRTSLCTLVGAYCGAVPPLIGWAAATGQLDYGAWVLGVMLYVWQIPHALALAWLCRRDYARAGVRILAAIDPSGRITCEVIILYCLALLPLSIMATLGHVAGTVYLIGALAMGLTLAGFGVRMYWVRTRTSARHLFLASVIYLPMMLGMMLADRGAPSRTGSVLGAEGHAARSQAWQMGNSPARSAE